MVAFVNTQGGWIQLSRLYTAHGATCAEGSV